MKLEQMAYFSLFLLFGDTARFFEFPERGSGRGGRGARGGVFGRPPPTALAKIVDRLTPNGVAEGGATPNPAKS